MAAIAAATLSWPRIPGKPGGGTPGSPNGGGGGGSEGRTEGPEAGAVRVQVCVRASQCECGSM